MLSWTADTDGERRVVRHVNPLSAAKVTFALGLTLAAIAAVGLVALYLLAVASGALRSVEGFIGGFGLGTGAYHLSIVRFLPGFVILSALGSVVLALLAGAAAVLYNSLSDLVGGVEIVTRRR